MFFKVFALLCALYVGYLGVQVVRYVEDTMLQTIERGVNLK